MAEIFFPEKMEHTDGMNADEILKIHDDYIRYIVERIDFAFNGYTNKKKFFQAVEDVVEDGPLAKELENEKSAREQAIDQLNEKIQDAGGLFTTVDPETGIVYMHDKKEEPGLLPPYTESRNVIMISTAGIAVSNDGGVTYPMGFTLDDGVAILNKIYAIGIDADHITTGRITDAQGNYSLDLDTGTVNMANANITGGSISVETDSQYASLMKINATTTNGNHYSSEITGVGLTVINEANGTKGAYNGSSFAISDNNTHKDYISGGEMPLGSDKGGVLTIANGNGDSCKIYPTTIMFMDSNNNVKGQYPANNTPVLLLTHNTSSWASTAHGDYYFYLLCACAGQGNRVVASTLIPRAFVSTANSSSNPCIAFLEGEYRVYCYFSGGNVYARTEGTNQDCYVKVYGMY